MTDDDLDAVVKRLRGTTLYDYDEVSNLPIEAAANARVALAKIKGADHE